MVGHLFNLLTRSLLDIRSRIGSNWGGVIFSLVLFLIAQGVTLIAAGKTPAQWKQDWLKNTLGEAAVVFVGWEGFYLCQTYDDHRNLAGWRALMFA